VTLDQPTRLYQVYKTIIQMLKDRGYITPTSSEDLSKEDFFAKFNINPADGFISREPLSLLMSNKNDPTDHICVFFPDEPKVGVKPIRKYCERMKDAHVQRAIIIVKQAMTTFAKQALAEMAHQGLTLEYFQETELLVNITQHQLVPRHILLSREEKQALLDRYKLKEAQLPRIQFSDPVARYYGLQRGQVVKIIRPSETAGRYVTYRLVV